MNKKKYNVSVPMQLRNFDNLWRESSRAMDFLINQINKGWNVREAMVQTEDSYGTRIVWYMCLRLNEYIN